MLSILTLLLVILSCLIFSAGRAVTYFTYVTYHTLCYRVKVRVVQSLGSQWGRTWLHVSLGGGQFLAIELHEKIEDYKNNQCCRNFYPYRFAAAIVFITLATFR